MSSCPKCEVLELCYDCKKRQSLSSELKECPWCQDTVQLRVTELQAFRGPRIQIECRSCWSAGPTAESHYLATKLWNQRGGPVNEPDELGCQYCRECDGFCPTLNGTGES